MATMQKWQVEHFENKVKRQFNPLIEDQELLIRQFRTEATNVAVDKLAKKMPVSITRIWGLENKKNRLSIKDEFIVFALYHAYAY